MALRDIQKPHRKVTLYHGTDVDSIKLFDIRKSRKSFLDFGRGIYFTTSFEQAMLWSTRHSEKGIVYEVEIDTSLLDIVQYLTYSDKFIDTFCKCRVGLESAVSDIAGKDAVYGYVIDNDKSAIVKATNDYAMGLTKAVSVRNAIHVFDDKDQLCIKKQNILNNVKIKRKAYTEHIKGRPKNEVRVVRWVR